MTMVVGFAPDGRGRAVLHLAGMLARSAGDELLVCAVIPLPWPPSPARVDAEYRAYLEGRRTTRSSRLAGGSPRTSRPATWCITRAPLRRVCWR
jgi:hypothetical protein